MNKSNNLFLQFTDQSVNGKPLGASAWSATMEQLLLNLLIINF
jgi:hypothetical protein